MSLVQTAMATLCLAAAALLSANAQATQQGRTLRVANNGLDSNGCGSKAQPCRSISQAMENAVPGDSILVGPGRYGDINDDSDYDDPGDEHGTPGLCVVCVNKPLRIVSTHGAATTVIRSALANPVFLPSIVKLFASGTTFGEPRRGFTITGGESNGLHSVDVDDMRISGNVALDNFESGFAVFGSGVFSDNIMTGSNIGLHAGGRWRLIDNVAIGNTVLGMGAGGDFILLRHNVSTQNGRGFTIGAGRAVLDGNLASGNIGEGVGFLLFDSDVTFVRNTAVGNRGYGVYFWTDDPPAQTIIKHNNMYGNDVQTNCGFVNRSSLMVDATQNYWGAATGPGPDPADNAGAGSGCDVSTGVTAVIPFAPKPFEQNRRD